jgi:hypothetical protein
MAPRGRCRCGKILRFPLTSKGYKRRCSKCGSIVRLRCAEPSPPVPPVPAVSASTGQSDYPAHLLTPETPADLSAVGQTAQSAAPALAEMEAYAEPERSRAWTWWLLALLAAAVVGGVGAAAMWWR